MHKSKQEEEIKKYALEYNLSQDEVMEIKEAFDLFDIDKSGSIQQQELKQALNQLGFEAKDQTIYQLMEQLDEDGSGSIEFHEFLSKMLENIVSKNSREELAKVFKLFADEQSEGGSQIKIENLRRIGQELGEEYTEQDFRDMLAKADVDGKGYVDLDDFYNVITGKTYS